MSGSSAEAPLLLFAKRLGIFMNHCGVLERLTNSAIMRLGRDPLLSSEMTRARFGRRIDLLRALLGGRTELPPSDVKDLCDELQEIARRRNMVAHNPIAAADSADPQTQSIVIVRYAPGGAEIKGEVTSQELDEFIDKAFAVLTKFAELVPECFEEEPQE